MSKKISFVSGNNFSNRSKAFGTIVEIPVADIQIAKYQKALNKERARKIAEKSRKPAVDLARWAAQRQL